MQAIKAIYKEGSVHLLSPLPDVSEAELFVIVLDKDDTAGGIARSFRTITTTSEEEFQAIGLTSFFDTEDDSNVSWEEVFGVQSR
jgi:hypothetical protein